MTTPPAAQVLLLGTFHFAENDDATAVDFDALAPERQQEIVTLTTQLAEFQPTVVAVEAEPVAQRQLNERYLAFREGRLEPSDNEIESISTSTSRPSGCRRNIETVVDLLP